MANTYPDSQIIATINNLGNNLNYRINTLQSVLQGSIGSNIGYLNSTIYNTTSNINNNLSYFGTNLSNAINRVEYNTQGKLTAIQNALNTYIAQPQQNILPAVNALGGNITQAQNAINAAINNSQSYTVGQIKNVQTTLDNTFSSKISALQNNLNTQNSGILNMVNSGNNTILGKLNAIDVKFSQLIEGPDEPIGGEWDERIAFILSEIAKRNADMVERFGYYDVQTQFVLRETVEKLSKAMTDSYDVVRRENNSLISNFSNLLNASVNTVGNVIANAINETTDDIEDIVNTPVSFAKDIVEDIISLLADETRKFLRSMGYNSPFEDTPLIKALNGKYNNIDEFFNAVGTNNATNLLVKLAYTIIFTASAIPKITAGIAEPAALNMKRLVNTQVRSSTFSGGDLTELYRRGIIDSVDVKNRLAKEGFPDDLIQEFMRLSKRLPDLSMLFQLFNRGEINRVQLNKFIGALGFEDEIEPDIHKLADVIPSIGDLIVFMVREVFTPEAVNKYGLDKDFPVDILKHTRAIGLNEEWTRNYWKSHWQLPSATQAYEMYHRRIITRSDLLDFLKTADYSEYWRNKLADLSFSPLTRVDVRRMYGMGVLSDKEVYESYLDIGYSPANALRLLNFTKKYESKEDNPDKTKVKKLSQSNIEKSYRLGLKSKTETVRLLKDTGYSDTDASMLLDMQDLDSSLDNIKEITDSFRKRALTSLSRAYTRRVISRSSAVSMLSSIGYNSTLADQHLNLLDYERTLAIKEDYANELRKSYIERDINQQELRVKLLAQGFNESEVASMVNELENLKSLEVKTITEAKAREFYQSGVITLEQYQNELYGLGYNQKYVNWFTIALGK